MRGLAAQQVLDCRCSVPGPRRIDVGGPAIDSSRKIVNVGKPECAQLSDSLRTADAVVAINNHFVVLPILNFICAHEQLTQGNQRGIRQGHEGVLFRLAHVE